MSAERIEAEAEPAAIGKCYPSGYPEKFIRFHTATPTVYEAMVEHAEKLKALGIKTVGVRFLFEFERIYGKHPKTQMQYVLDNNLSPSYGRLMCERVPDLRGFIRLRSTAEELEAEAGQTILEFDDVGA